MEKGPSKNRTNWIYRYSTFADAPAYIALGWVPLPYNVLSETHHGETAIVLEWICDTCPPPNLTSEAPATLSESDALRPARTAPRTTTSVLSPMTDGNSVSA